MRKPTVVDCADEEGNIDWEEYDEALTSYEESRMVALREQEEEEHKKKEELVELVLADIIADVHSNYIKYIKEFLLEVSDEALANYLPKGIRC